MGGKGLRRWAGRGCASSSPPHWGHGVTATICFPQGPVWPQLNCCFHLCPGDSGHLWWKQKWGLWRTGPLLPWAVRQASGWSCVPQFHCTSMQVTAGPASRQVTDGEQATSVSITPQAPVSKAQPQGSHCPSLCSMAQHTKPAPHQWLRSDLQQKSLWGQTYLDWAHATISLLL